MLNCTCYLHMLRSGHTTPPPVNRGNVETVSKHTPIRLDDTLPLWDQQRGESTTNYDAFRRWLALKPSARLAHGHQQIADDTGRRRSVVTKTAHLHRWAERAAAYDQHINAVHTLTDVEQARAAHTRNAHVAEQLTDLFTASLGSIDPADLTPAIIVRLGDLALRWRTAIYGQAPQHINVQADMQHAVTATVDHTVAELTDMSPADRDARIQQLNDDVARKRTIISSEIHHDQDQDQRNVTDSV